MKPSQICICVILLSVFGAAHRVQAGFIIPSWNLATGVFIPDSSDGESISVVQNPLETSVHAQIENSRADSSYDLAWQEQAGTGRFFTESSLVTEGVGGGTRFTISENRIRITPSTPITINVHAEYTFNLPVDHMRTDFQFVALGLTSGTVAFLNLQGFDTTMGPGADTLFMNDQFVLPPTETWHIRSTMRIDALSGTQGIGTGSGFFDIQIVPEPNMIAVLAFGGLLSSRVFRRRSAA